MVSTGNLLSNQLLVTFLGRKGGFTQAKNKRLHVKLLQIRDEQSESDLQYGFQRRQLLWARLRKCKMIRWMNFITLNHKFFSSLPKIACFREDSMEAIPKCVKCNIFFPSKMQLIFTCEQQTLSPFYPTSLLRQNATKEIKYSYIAETSEHPPEPKVVVSALSQPNISGFTSEPPGRLYMK